MRHRKRHSKLSMKTSHRKAALRSIVTSLLKYQRIKIGLARAKVARRLAEQMITLAKTGSVDARRRAYAVLADRDMVGKLFKEVAPLFQNRTSGYTRIIPLGFRRGDGTQLCLLELTEKKIVAEKLPKKKKAKAEDTKHAPDHAKQEPADTKRDAKTKTAEAPIPKSKPTVAEEKMREKAKSEDKKLVDKRGFMKNLRGLFRKRGDF